MAVVVVLMSSHSLNIYKGIVCILLNNLTHLWYVYNFSPISYHNRSLDQLVCASSVEHRQKQLFAKIYMNLKLMKSCQTESKQNQSHQYIRRGKNPFVLAIISELFITRWQVKASKITIPYNLEKIQTFIHLVILIITHL